jgi:hypothetical protein
MLCSRAGLIQEAPPPPPLKPCPEERLNVAAALPRALWMEILSYTHRNWFEQPPTEISVLRSRVHQLEFSLERTQEEKRDLEKQLLLCQRESDAFREMARRWQLQVDQAVAGVSHDELLGHLLHHLRDNHHRDSDDESDDEEEGAGVDEMDEDNDTETNDADESISISPPTGVGRSQVRTVSISSSADDTL